MNIPPSVVKEHPPLSVDSDTETSHSDNEVFMLDLVAHGTQEHADMCTFTER